MEASHQHYIQQINELKERLAIELSRNHALATSAAHGAHPLSLSCTNSSNGSLLEQTFDDDETRFKTRHSSHHAHRAVKQKALRRPRHVAVDYEAPSGDHMNTLLYLIVPENLSQVSSLAFNL